MTVEAKCEEENMLVSQYSDVYPKTRSFNVKVGAAVRA